MHLSWDSTTLWGGVNRFRIQSWENRTFCCHCWSSCSLYELICVFVIGLIILNHGKINRKKIFILNMFLDVMVLSYKLVICSIQNKYSLNELMCRTFYSDHASFTHSILLPIQLLIGRKKETRPRLELKSSSTGSNDVQVFINQHLWYWYYLCFTFLVIDFHPIWIWLVIFTCLVVHHLCFY